MILCLFLCDFVKLYNMINFYIVDIELYCAMNIIVTFFITNKILLKEIKIE